MSTLELFFDLVFAFTLTQLTELLAHHLSLIANQGEEYEVAGGISDQVADIGDELYAASDREKLREWGNQIDAPEKAH